MLIEAQGRIGLLLLVVAGVAPGLMTPPSASAQESLVLWSYDTGG